MSRSRTGARTAARGAVIDGVYAKLSAATYRGQDPRAYLAPDGSVAEVQAALAVHSVLLDKLDANEAVVVPKWRITGNSNPGLRQRFPWLAGPGCVRVHPDDTVELTDDPADGH